MAREVAAGRLEPFVVGEHGDEARTTTMRIRRRRRRRRRARWDDGRRCHGRGRVGRAIAAEQRRAAGDRVRRPAERRQVDPAERAARRGAGDRVRGARDDPRRHRHDDRRGAAARSCSSTRPASGGAARSPAGPPRSAIRRSARSRPSSRADVAVLVLDAVDGLTAQDAHVAGYVVEEGRGLVVAVNKWDLVEERPTGRSTSTWPWIRREAAVPRVRAGRLDQREDRPARAARCSSSRSTSGASAASASPRGELNRLVGAAVERQPPPIVKRPPAEDLLRDAGRGRAADVRVLRDRRGGGALLATGATSRTGCARRSAFDGTPIRLVFREGREQRPRGRGRAGARRR